MLDRLFNRHKGINSEEEAYLRLFNKGYQPASIVDVGAYEGNWTRLARRVFPDASILMVEPQASKAALLQSVVKELPRTQFEAALLASEPDLEVIFYEMETGSSMLPERSNVARDEKRLKTKTLDQLTANLSHPIFLKIDAQGAELEILKGAQQTVTRCDFIQLEVALLPYNAGAPDFLRTVTYMNGLGFVPYDFSGFTRPNGKDLVQVDIIFCRETSPLRPDFFTF